MRVAGEAVAERSPAGADAARLSEADTLQLVRRWQHKEAE